MADLLIPNMPPDLQHQLEESAARHQRTLAMEVVMLLREAMGNPERPTERPAPFKGRFPLTQELLDQAQSERRG